MAKSPTLSLRLLAAGSMSALALGMAGPALAQTAPQDGAQASDDTGGIKEIVVTAQFRSQKLQDTPIAITAITGDALEQRSANALTDIANSAPSVVLRPASAAFGNSITASIRGFGQIDFNPAYEPGVGLYIDDVYYPRLTGANFDLLDVERVEVLRGPQGTLTGRNSEGGAIRFISRKPTGDGSGYLSATYGIRNRINLRGSADFTLAKDLYARISGTFAEQQGFVNVLDYGCANPGSGQPSTTGGTKCTSYKLGDVGYRALRGILRYNPSDKLDVMISADYTKDSHNNGAEVLLYANNPNPNVRTVGGLPYDSRFICGRWCNYTSTGQEAGSFVAGLIPPLNGFPLAATTGQQSSDYEGWGVSGNIDFSLNDALKLQSITAYRGWKSSFSIDNDLSPARVGFGNNELTHWFWSQELRLNAKLGEIADATVGGYYSDEKTTYYTLQDIRYVAANIPGVGLLPIFPLQFIGNDPVRTKSKAVFGTVIVRPTSALTLTAGVRYTKDEKAYTFFRYNLDGTTINPFLDRVGALNGAGYDGPNGTALTGRTALFSGDRVDYRVSLDYRFSPEVLAYATVSTGYKAGGVGPRPFNAAQARGFGPEKLTSYEIGLKTDFFDRRVRLNLAGFFNDFKDAQLTLLSCPQFGGPGPCALPQNAGNAHVKGVEAELFARPIDGLQIDASISYIDWKWKCVNPAVVGGASGPCSSDPAVVGLLSPKPRGLIKTKWSFGIQYDAEVNNIGTFTPRFDISYQSSLAGGDVAPTPGSPSELFGQVPGFTIANARLTWQNVKKDLSIAFEVTNLFDKYYFLSKFDLTGAGAGAITGQPGRPREWGVTIKKKF
ncbi:MAG: TonB-dependent receptor [Sphingomonadales bacterium]|nr:TonB-dependent receptor [Sphingomonadales bacterium]